MAPSIKSVGVRFKFPITDPEKVTTLNPTGAVDLAVYGTRQLYFKKPDGTELAPVTPSLLTPPGTDGVLYYDNAAAFFTPAGRWKVRARIMADATHDYWTDGWADLPIGS